MLILLVVFVHQPLVRHVMWCHDIQVPLSRFSQRLTCNTLLLHFHPLLH